MSQVATRPQVETIIRRILEQQFAPNGSSTASAYTPNLKVNISARHCHLTQEHVDILFGKGYQLTVMKGLYQATDFASKETISIVGPRQRMIPGVRILGPCRQFSQIELAFTDAISLGLDLPVRLSGDIEGTPGALIVGPAGSLLLDQGVIRAERHVHMGPRDAEYYGVKHLDRMDLTVDGPCAGVLKNLLVRTHPDWKLEVHIDTDEANALDLPHASQVKLVRAS